jgi:hypothetical protein
LLDTNTWETNTFGLHSLLEKIDGCACPCWAICGDEQVVKDEPRTTRKHPISLGTKDSAQTRPTKMLARRLQKSAVRSAPTKAAAPLPAAGGAGKKGGGMWAALADSDTDSDTAPEEVSVPVVAVKTAKEVVLAPLPSAAEASATVASLFADPLFVAMGRGEVHWGDLLLAEQPLVALPVTPPPAEEDDEPLRALWDNPHAPLRATEGEIWQQPFSADLEEYWPETYDTRAMSDEDFHALMSWLYSKGWYVKDFNREGVQTWPDNAPSRRWDAAAMAPEEERHVRWADEAPAPARACGGAGHSHHGHRAPKPKNVTIPRFCREGSACAAGASCRYVHGDTIPRINEVCAFGAGCGASDPTGVKRSQCLRMHPGETWTPELVIRRV